MIFLYNHFMKKFLIPLILCAAFNVNFIQPADAGFLTSYKAQVEKNRIVYDAQKSIKTLFDKQTDYTNKYEYEKLYNLYSDDFINNDGYNKKVYFKLIKETWETYPDITYETRIKDINVYSDYATVQTEETAYATTTEDTELISARGELRSYANCIYHLKKINNRWVISGENVLEEKSTLKYGDARFIKMELSAPSFINAGQSYTSELKIDLPEDEVVIASINREKITQPAVKSEDAFRRLPSDQILERMFISNKDNINEYNIASVGIAKSESVDNTKIRVYMSGLAFIMTRINVVPENHFINLEEENAQKSK